MISIEQLWERIDSHTVPLTVREVPLSDAVGCAVAVDVMSPLDLPAFDQSAMDGYAFAGIAPGSCEVVVQIAAGDVPEKSVSPGEAARILTGALLPAGAVCVARQEDCTVENARVRLREGVTLKADENIRFRGGVCPKGSKLVRQGTAITSGVVALLASCGIARLPVHPHPRALHIATGYELIGPEEAPYPGKIYDSNGPMIECLLALAGVRAQRLRLQDSFDDLARCVKDFSGDLLLLSGGSGPGDHDHAHAAFRDAGYTVHVSQIASRPGKPLIFATRGRQVAFGLPGNPLSQWVCYHAFVSRSLARLRGLPSPGLVEARLSCPLASGGDGRRTWTPARRSYERGQLVVEPLPWKHSGDLTPLASADALILDFPDSATHLVKTLLL